MAVGQQLGFSKPVSKECMKQRDKKESRRKRKESNYVLDLVCKERMPKQQELQSRDADQAGHQVVRGKQIEGFLREHD